mmetsp:Transcript_49301/g.127152  ORF Transcript_49301/g.127152 Transcript_49301/m.127152 type:complete len:228 (+) Transcript_49301:82-765(+)
MVFSEWTCCAGTTAKEQEINVLQLPGERDSAVVAGAVISSCCPANAPATTTPPNRFSVSLLKQAGTATIGVILDPSDARTLQVCSLQTNSIVGAYNQEARSELQIRVGDAITAVNGFSSTAEEMTDELVKSDKCEFQVARPAIRFITVDKHGGALGLKLNYAKRGRSLCIDRIGEGAIMDWNTANLSEPVQEKDRIMSVNGVEGNPAELLAELGSAAVVKLQLGRVV